MWGRLLPATILLCCALNGKDRFSSYDNKIAGRFTIGFFVFSRGGIPLRGICIHPHPSLTPGFRLRRHPCPPAAGFANAKQKTAVKQA